MYLNSYQANAYITTTQSESIAKTLLNYVTTFVPRGKSHYCEFYDNTSCFS